MMSQLFSINWLTYCAGTLFPPNSLRPYELVLPAGVATGVVSGLVKMPSGKTCAPQITDNNDGTATVRYQPNEKVGSIAKSPKTYLYRRRKKKSYNVFMHCRKKQYFHDYVTGFLELILMLVEVNFKS